jgi:hypothetical protein
MKTRRRGKCAKVYKNTVAELGRKAPLPTPTSGLQNCIELDLKSVKHISLD